MTAVRWCAVVPGDATESAEALENRVRYVNGCDNGNCNGSWGCHGASGGHGNLGRRSGPAGGISPCAKGNKAGGAGAEYVHAYITATGNEDPAVAEARMQAESEDPAVQEAVLEAVRGLDEALSDVVMPALARLTRLYTAERKPADYFFRGLRRLLQELNSDAFVELVGLLRSFKDASVPPIREISSDQPPFNTPAVGDILHLMQTNGLAAPDDVGRWGSSTGPLPPRECAIIETSVARQILAIVDSSEELRRL